MAWTLLLVPALYEIVWAVGLKYTEGFTRVLPTVVTVVAMIVSVVCLALALRTIPVGTGYAVWTGIGAVGTALIGILVFNDPANFWRVFFIITLIGSIIGLKAEAN